MAEEEQQTTVLSENQQPAPGKRARRWPLLIAIVLVLGAGLYSWRKLSVEKQRQAAKPAVRRVPIEVGQAAKGRINLYVRALGTVVPLHSVTAVSQVQGQILKVNFQEGQSVRKGDSLVKIDPRPFQAALLEAEGTLARDRSLLKQAQTNLARYKQAYAERAIAKQQFDDQVQLVEQSKAAVKTSEGALTTARINLAYCDVISPIDGQVGLRLIDPGNFVQAGVSQLAVITQLEPITVIFSIAEDSLASLQAQIRRGGPIPVDAFDRAQQRKLAGGTFLALDNQIDPTTGTVRVRAQFDNKDHALFPNQFVNAKLLVETRDDVILVPSVAVQFGPQGAFVYAIQPDQTAKVQTVKVDATEGDRSAVQGLEVGQTIAVNGFDKLQNGAHVIVRPQPELNRKPATSR